MMLAIEHPWVFWPLFGWVVFLLVWGGAGAMNIDRPASTQWITAILLVGVVVLGAAMVWFVVALLWWSFSGEWL